MSDIMDFSVVSTKGRPMMHYKNKLFTKSKETRNADGIQSKVYWSCSRRGCRGSVNYARVVNPDNPEDGGIITNIIEREHDDLCTTTSVDIFHRIARSEIIRQAASGASLGTVRAAVLDPLLALNPLAGATMQSAASLQSSFSRAARAALPPIPAVGNMDQLIIPLDFQLTGGSEQFLMFHDNSSSEGSGSSDCTILAFCTFSFFQALCDATTVFIDGTFMICPAGFEQYLTLHTLRGPSSRLIPGMYCLLTNKSDFIYNRLFVMIMAKAAEMDIAIRWQFAVTDYEPGLERALLSVFSSSIIRRGSHFHFTIAVYKFIHNILGAAYKNEATGLRVVIKKIFALAFLEQLPALDSAFGEAALDLMFNILKAELLALQSPLVPLDALNSFIFYFESKWMSCREDWNLFNFDDHRASNDLEMWHVNMNQAINRKDNLWKFIKSLAAEQTLREGEVNKILSGHDAPPQRRSQKQKEEVIAAAKADYSSRRISALEYVNRLSYRMGH